MLIFLAIALPVFPCLYGQNGVSSAAALDLIEKRFRVNPDSCRKAIRLIRITGLKELAKATYLTGNCWLYSRQSDSALKYFQKAESMTGSISGLEAQIQYGMGSAYFDKPDYTKAKSAYLKVLKLCSNGVDKELIMMANNDLGIIFYEKNKPDSAILHYKESLKYARESGDKYRMANTMNNISLGYYRLGNFEKAIEWQLDAIKYKELLNDTVSLATSLNNVGGVFIKLKKYQEANRYLKRAYNMLADRKNGRIKGFSAINLGISYKMLNNFDSAVFFYHKALSIYTAIGLEDNKGKVYTNLGALYEARKQYDQALGYMLKALDGSRKLNKPTEVAIRSRNIANLYLLMHKPELARNYILHAQKLASGVGSLELNKDVYYTLAIYYEQTGKYKEALQWHKEFSRMNDSLYSESSQKTINELNTKYETAIKEKEILTLHKQQQIADLELIQKRDALLRQKLILLFTIIIVLLISLASYLGFNRYRLKQRNARELLARQKTELEQRMLLAQMNPHFIFNSLGSVQNFIGMNEPLLAQQFLSKFARLMRSILENSRRQFVPLDEEVSALSLYTELEKQRFGDRFTYKIEVLIDEPEFILIPPMLVQPFVENAILHGFISDKVTGLLQVKYYMEDDLITCLIEDNGVGRTRTTAAGNKHPGHVSLGGSVVAERIELLKLEYKINASIRYTDLTDADGTPCGTRVVLRLPFKERTN
jgi:tetratricopeptide (TPR) repeat protein